MNIHTDLCLCGRGQLMRDCCLFVRCDATPPGPATGYAHPLCFARSLNDCCQKISREHYISESVFKLFRGNMVAVSGAHWVPHSEEKLVSVASLTGKMLCTRHNSALSSLDTFAAKFFRFFTAEWSEDEVEVNLIRGYDLERWILKMLCGLVASGIARYNGEPLSGWVPPEEWLEILFGSTDVESPSGLHITAGNYLATRATLHVKPAFKTNSAEPIALVFALEGIIIMLSMERLPPLSAPSKTGAKTYFRPKALQLRRDDQIREAHFGWPDGDVVPLGVSVRS